METKKTKKTAKKSVLVTTIHRGVFWGRLVGVMTSKSVTLEGARCAIYWGTTKGFIELASVGPNEKSKIGAFSPGTIVLHDATSVTECSAEATAAWEKA